MELHIQHEANAILQKIEGGKLRHVPDSERRSAVIRAIEFGTIRTDMAVDELLKHIDASEAQMDVHSDASDPKEREAAQRCNFGRSQMMF